MLWPGESYYGEAMAREGLWVGESEGWRVGGSAGERVFR